ncbi:uncharacterized protein LOC119584338 [Penaeus monodon]|uniref:uncharacterized protein LOC119584338 n=1 Tax=Penaeus monodon TaxID=6687 RepID=UPI0018A769A8|nr:uncharacterized protein LOC119584338 [Penaeus monodon]
MKTQKLLQGPPLFLLLLLGLSCIRAVPRRQRDSVEEKKVNAINALVELLTEDKGKAATGDETNKAAGEEGDMAATMKDLAAAIKNNTKALLTNMEEKEEAKCDPPYFAAGSECFYVNNHKRLTWVEAQNFCRGLGGDLAEPDRVNMLRAVLLQKYPEDENQFFWVGHP